MPSVCYSLASLAVVQQNDQRREGADQNHKTHIRRLRERYGVWVLEWGKRLRQSMLLLSPVAADSVQSTVRPGTSLPGREIGARAAVFNCDSQAEADDDK